MSSFIEELRRRNVIRSATAYLVVGWLLLQVADIILEFVEAPAWVGKALIGLLALGFFVTLILSWVLEVTADGIRADDGTSAPDSVRAQRLDVITIIAALGVAALFAWQALRPPPAETASAPATTAAGDSDSRAVVTTSAAAPAPVSDASIAVLPFDDLSPGGDQAYFSDGIAEEILNVLTSIDELSVASRTSSFAFKGQREIGIPEIAEELRVRYVLEGSVRTAGQRIRITAQLIDARTDKHVWSQTFDDELAVDSVFEIQDKIAKGVVEQLSAALQLDDMTMSDSMVDMSAETENLDAYQLFLQGRQRFRVRSVSNIPGTIEIFERVVALDPDFARGWAELAAVLAVAPSWGIAIDGEDLVARADAAARRALALDDSQALPYAVLAYNERSNLPMDFAYSFAHYEQALARDPDNTSALLWRALDRITAGFFEAAIEDLQRCQQIDPGYQNCVAFEAVARLYNRDIDTALEMYEALAAMRASSQSMTLALAQATHGERRAALMALAWAAEAFDYRLAPALVYAAVTDPDFDAEAAYRRHVRQQAAVSERLADGDFRATDYEPVIFRRYDLYRPSPEIGLYWHPSLPEFLASPERKLALRTLGVYDYWKMAGFPPQCRALGDDDFSCD